MYNNVDVRNGFYGVIHYNDDGSEKYFEEKGKEVTLEEIRNNIEDGEITWRVSFEYVGHKKRFDISRNSIAEKKLASFLQGKGADITAKTFNNFVDSMRLQESYTPNVKNVYSKLGWLKTSHNGILEYTYRCNELIGNVNGTYDGNIALKPQGTLDGWKEMVINEVLGRPPLEVILLAALSAPIVGIHGINSETDNPIYHINYRSGMGKSTSCYLAASVSGEPFDGTRRVYDSYGTARDYSSIYGSWGATPKATISSHSGNRGVVVVLNELGKFVGADMTTIVFNLSEGSDIKRLNTQLQTLVAEGFNTVFISCGEMSLIDRCKSKLEGIKNRVLEIAVPMTDDAEHSRRIKEGCCKNNGFAAPVIAKYIMDNGGYEMVQELYNETLNELTLSAPAGVSGRFIEKFPTFLVMAAKLAAKALGLTFNIESVIQFCYDCANQCTEEDGEICKSFDEIIEKFEINKDNFYDDKRPDFVPKTVWGKIRHSSLVENEKQLIKEYYVFPNQLKTMLNEAGYPNPVTELKIWRNKGALNCDASHLTNKVTLKIGDKDTTRMYVVQVWKPIAHKKTGKSQLGNLLAVGETDSIEKGGNR